jgi:hypothetical protein
MAAKVWIRMKGGARAILVDEDAAMVLIETGEAVRVKGPETATVSPAENAMKQRPRIRRRG